MSTGPSLTSTTPTRTFNWAGRRVVLTGASSGIGASLARELAAAGAVVAMCARRSELLDAVLADCRKDVPACRAWTVDLADAEQVDTFADEVTAALGHVDVLIHNAALSDYHAAALTTSRDDLEYLMQLNYLSPVWLTQRLVPTMVEHGGGRVVVVSSMAARMSAPGEAAYAAAKAALSTYFEALATELFSSGVAVHLVYPALIDLTPGLDGNDAIADTRDSGAPIPAPVLARAMLRQVEQGDLELFMPHSAREAVTSRARDLEGSIAMMAAWYEREAAMPPPSD